MLVLPLPFLIPLVMGYAVVLEKEIITSLMVKEMFYFLAKDYLRIVNLMIFVLLSKYLITILVLMR